MLVTRALVALGFVGAMAIGTPAPSLAQGVYIGPGGVGIDTGRPRYERGRYGGCRTVTIERDDGSVRRVRRCD
jgi:hypothetical protein